MTPNPALLAVFAAVAGLAACPAFAAQDPQTDACTLAAQPLADPLVHVPFETVDGRIYVKAQVNGQGPFRFAVDTGASGSGRADSTLVTQLGLPLHGESSTSDGVRSARVDTVHIASLQLGDLVRTDLQVIARDYASRGTPEAAFSGILARGFFADGLLLIDYPRRLLSFSQSAQLPATARNVLTYERAFRIPVRIGTQHVQGQLDTGANVSFVVPQVLYDQIAAGELGDAVAGQLTNGQIAARRATMRGPFQVGQVVVSEVPVRVSSDYPELLIGADVLQDAVVLIDQRSQAVAVCR